MLLLNTYDIRNDLTDEEIEAHNAENIEVFLDFCEPGERYKAIINNEWVFTFDGENALEDGFNEIVSFMDIKEGINIFDDHGSLLIIGYCNCSTDECKVIAGWF